VPAGAGKAGRRRAALGWQPRQVLMRQRSQRIAGVACAQRRASMILPFLSLPLLRRRSRRRIFAGTRHDARACAMLMFDRTEARAKLPSEITERPAALFIDATSRPPSAFFPPEASPPWRCDVSAP